MLTQISTSHAMPELNEDEEKSISSHEASQIKLAYGIALKTAEGNKNIAEEAVVPSCRMATEDSSMWTQKKLDINKLIALRYKHQTEAASKAIRTRGLEKSGQKTTPSLRHEFNRKFQAVVQEQQDQAIETGLGRRVRHNMPLPASVKSGNAANAELAAKEVANKVSSNLLRVLLYII